MVRATGYIIKRSESVRFLTSERAQIAPRAHRVAMQGGKCRHEMALLAGSITGRHRHSLSYSEHFFLNNLIFYKARGIMILPNQLNIFSKGYFYLYGIFVSFFAILIYEFDKNANSTEYGME